MICLFKSASDSRGKLADRLDADTVMRTLLRYLSYPAIVGAASWMLISMAQSGGTYWPLFPLMVLAAYALISVLERVIPFEKSWLTDHDDTVDDALHLITTQVLIQGSIAFSFLLGAELQIGAGIWPSSWPMLAQVLLAGLILDFGLYVMHRVSHVNDFLWRLHAIHHSPERLYWLNGGRRHALSGIVLAAPALTVLVLAGATPIAVATWFSIMSIHLAFQHANIDYRLGPFRYLLGVAELHRWHHKREYEDAQVNFGEVWMVWDLIFGTFHDAPRSPGRGEVGLGEYKVPDGYLNQLTWPFRSKD